MGLTRTNRCAERSRKRSSCISFWEFFSREISLWLVGGKSKTDHQGRDCGRVPLRETMGRASLSFWGDEGLEGLSQLGASLGRRWEAPASPLESSPNSPNVEVGGFGNKIYRDQMTRTEAGWPMKTKDAERGKLSGRHLQKAGVRCRLSQALDLKFGPSLRNLQGIRQKGVWGTRVLESPFLQLFRGWMGERVTNQQALLPVSLPRGGKEWTSWW